MQKNNSYVEAVITKIEIKQKKKTIQSKTIYNGMQLSQW